MDIDSGTPSLETPMTDSDLSPNTNNSTTPSGNVTFPTSNDNKTTTTTTEKKRNDRNY